MKKLLLILTSSIILCQSSIAQNVGFGTTTPKALLHVADSSVLFSVPGMASGLPGNPPASGAGSRTMWYADKAAFRSGYVGAAQWDKDSIGDYSVALGYNTKAKGLMSFAIGDGSEASDYTAISMGLLNKAVNNNAIAMGVQSYASATASVAIGWNDSATGTYAVAMGYQAKSRGQASIALGYRADASGSSAIALGERTKSTGFYSTAMGYSSLASGNSSLAAGSAVEASGNHSTAIGYYASTNGFNGACVIADAATTSKLNSSATNQMSMRFSGGYKLYSNSFYTAGVGVSAGGGSWSNISDRRLKENFRTIDHEELLQKVASLPITNWNYKSQPTSQRHIGPMAQDFYAAFHLDGEGADTTINTMDISGVNMAAIQALEKRTSQLTMENGELKMQNAKLEDAVTRLQAQMQELRQALQPKMTQR